MTWNNPGMTRRKVTYSQMQVRAADPTHVQTRFGRKATDTGASTVTFGPVRCCLFTAF